MPKRSRKERLKEAITLIPLTYNDGSVVPRRILDSIHDEIFAVFGGWTIEGVVKGAYRMQSGQQQVEDLQRISIVLPESMIPELERMIRRWGAILGQETMILKITDSKVKFIEPETDLDQS